jgi:hypothetical protein
MRTIPPPRRGSKQPVGGEDGGILAPNLETLTLVTKDDFDTVLKHYQKVFGKELGLDEKQASKLFKLDMKGSSIMDTRTSEIDDSINPDETNRPVRFRVLVHHAKNYNVTLVISRSKEEKVTHIDVVFRDND